MSGLLAFASECMAVGVVLEVMVILAGYAVRSVLRLVKKGGS